MTPSGASGAARTARTHVAPRPADAAKRQPALEVVDRREGRLRARRRRALPVLSAAVVSLSLLAVVVGHSLVAQDQVRLASVQAELSQAQTTQRTEVVAVGQLDNPTRITSEALTDLHMSAVTQLIQLPWVSLSTPLPAPSVAPAPATAPASPGTSTAPSAGTGATTSSSPNATSPSQ